MLIKESHVDVRTSANGTDSTMSTAALSLNPDFVTTSNETSFFSFSLLNN